MNKSDWIEMTSPNIKLFQQRLEIIVDLQQKLNMILKDCPKIIELAKSWNRFGKPEYIDSKKCLTDFKKIEDVQRLLQSQKQVQDIITQISVEFLSL